MSDLQLRKDNLQSQLTEIETLQSIYGNEGELKFDDSFHIEQIESFIKNQTDEIPLFIDFTINLKIEDAKFEVSFNLCHEYPQVPPEVYIRCDKLTRKHQQTINQDCIQFIDSLIKDEPHIFAITSWIEENANKYMEVKCEELSTESQRLVDDDKLIRMWIYSHHIYNKTKRREILNLAQTLKLTGFCMPGKPGVICIEGYSRDCNTWWMNIKAMTWQKIMCKVTEDCSKRRFEKFEEVCFVNPNTTHANLGELKQFLEQNELGFIFKELFGIESKS